MRGKERKIKRGRDYGGERAREGEGSEWMGREHRTEGEGSGNGRIQLNEQIRNPFTAARREALMLTSLALSDFRNRVKPA